MANTDKLRLVGKPGTATTLSAPGHTSGGTSITVGSTTNWPTTTGVTFAIDRVTVSGSTETQVAGTYTLWVGDVTGATTIANMTLHPDSPNSDQNYSAGSTTRVYIPVSTATHNDLVTALLVSHDQDGTLKAGAVDNVAVFASGVISSTTPFSTALNPTTHLDETTFDFVASGCVWSGDAYGSTRVASMTSGVVYIDGARVPVSAVTSRTFTASRDTYIDVGSDGVVDYNEVTNNNTSPALASGHIRLGIIVTGASNIANVGSVNQGQEDKVLPIASSTPYAVTDSLGNLICPRDPNRKLIGHRRITTDQGSITTPTDITGLTFSVITDGLRKVRLKALVNLLNTTVDAYQTIQIREGATVLQIAGANSRSGASIETINVDVIITPTAGTHTYKLLTSPSAGTTTVDADAVQPSYFSAEYI